MPLNSRTLPRCPELDVPAPHQSQPRVELTPRAAWPAVTPSEQCVDLTDVATCFHQNQNCLSSVCAGLWRRQWVGCPTCKRGYTGEMVVRMARAEYDSTRHLAEADPDRLGAANNLAWVLVSEGELDDARALMRETAAKLAAALGPEHRDTLGAHSNLATVMMQLDEHDAAVASMRETLAVQRRVLGQEDEDTLATESRLAGWLCELGQRPDDNDDDDGSAAGDAAGPSAMSVEGLEMLTHTLEVQRRTLGHGHDHTLSTCHALAEALMSAKQAGRAVPLLRDGFASARRAAGPDHSQTLELRTTLGLALLMTGSYAEAVPVLQEISAVFHRMHGPVRDWVHAPARLCLGDPAPPCWLYRPKQC